MAKQADICILESKTIVVKKEINSKEIYLCRKRRSYILMKQTIIQQKDYLTY